MIKRIYRKVVPQNIFGKAQSLKAKAEVDVRAAIKALTSSAKQIDNTVEQIDNLEISLEVSRDNKKLATTAKLSAEVKKDKVMDIIQRFTEDIEALE